MEATRDYAFEKGWYQLRQRDVSVVRAKIMATLGITTRMGFRARLTGKYIPKVTEAKAIEEIFARYGVKDVWGAV
jgi:hypothetical protein